VHVNAPTFAWLMPRSDSKTACVLGQNIEVGKTWL
jgi:hypothetical protein